MTIDTDRLDDAVLALLYLTLHDQDQASKGFDGDALGRLHEKGMIESPVSESLTFTPDGLRRSKQLFESMFARRAAEVPASDGTRTEHAAKYPDIRVELADLGGQMFPILRRVSYAMSDAGIDDDVIEQYKNEVKASDDPVSVSSRWVSVR
jgi:uncharacterized protein DUF6429